MPFSTNFDVLYTICEEVYYTAEKHDLATLCLVSKQTNIAATPWLYRCVVFDLSSKDNPPTKNLIDVLSKLQPSYRRLARDVTLIWGSRRILSDSSVTSSGNLNIRAFAQLLASLSNVQCFRWKLLDVDQNALSSAIDNHHSTTEIALYSLSQSNLNSSFLRSWLSNECLGISSTDIEQGTEEITSLGIPNLAILGLESFQIQSLDLSFEGFGHLYLVAHRIRLKESIIINEPPMPLKIILKAYNFSPDCTALQQHIDFSKLETLELMNCANLGFLFNSMLCTYEIYYLKVLRIRGGTLQSQHAGYFGKEKLERFLMLHTGLQELTFANLGVNRPSLQAVSAQGATLQALIMHESKCLNPSNAMQRSTLSADALRHLSERCPRVQHLSVDLSTNNLSCSSEIAGDLRRYQSITRLEISLPSREQSLSLDRAWAIKTFTNVASPRLKRLDIYSGKSHSDSTGLQDTYKQNSGCHWRIDSVGKDLLAADITPWTDGPKRMIVPI